MRLKQHNTLALLLAPAVMVVAGCGGRVSASDAGTASDAGSDAGSQCQCVNDPSWPGQDCGEIGQTAVCCWLTPHATCCP